jgi:hypothetical protein
MSRKDPLLQSLLQAAKANIRVMAVGTSAHHGVDKVVEHVHGASALSLCAP